MEKYVSKEKLNKIKLVKLINKEEYSLLVALREDGIFDVYHVLPDRLKLIIRIDLQNSTAKYVSLDLDCDTVYAANEVGQVSFVLLHDICLQAEDVQGSEDCPEDIDIDNDITVYKFTVKGPISALTKYPGQYLFAYGGKENDLKLVTFDLPQASQHITKIEHCKTVFEAKNVKHDKLDLRVPIWITNIFFLSKDSLITTTNYGQIRTYSISHGRKPTSSVQGSQHRIISAVKTADDGVVIFSDDHASVVKFNITKKLVLGKYAGSQGSVNALNSYVTDNMTILLSGGLDRYFRAYDLDTRQQVVKVYVNSAINGVEYVAEPGPEESDESDFSDDEAEFKRRKVGK